MMDHTGHNSAMDRRIFQMGFSVETVSVYLLVCGLEDAGTTLRRTEMKKRWNGSETELDRGLAELEEKSIVQRVLHSTKGEDGDVVYRLTDPHSWRG
ncbi:MAG: hypothetical protein LJE65_14685 [Desulfobacteraceae bacterium]|nr:hypothetical protein [Desulfobacteraceae bacterium]